MDKPAILDDAIAIINWSSVKAHEKGEPFELPTVLFFGPIGNFRLKPREDDPRLVELDNQVEGDSTPPAS